MKNYKNFKNKKVLITGHNGFKGTWLCVWLSLLGANIIGISLKNKTIFQIDYDPCKGRLDFNEKLKFKKGINKLKSADIIILSTRWTSEDLNNLENVLELLKNKKKKSDYI